MRSGVFPSIQESLASVGAASDIMARKAQDRKVRFMAEIAIQRKWCKSCGICVEFCPKKVFTVGELNEPIISTPDACTGCRMCELRCPEFAIIITEVEESSHG
jgi:2-oxoglutarate ferredoxin oxidoreductase subunit delta